MNRRKHVPEPIIVPIQSGPERLRSTQSPRVTETHDARLPRVEEFLQARSISPRSQKAYRRDLQHFLNWTKRDWTEITPQHIAQFKAHLPKLTGLDQRQLSDATIRRILGTLKMFYEWMVQSENLSYNPTTQVQLPKLRPVEVQPFQDSEIEQIYQAAGNTSLPDRNVALVSILLHGLRAEELSGLNLDDYNGQQLRIRSGDSDNWVWLDLGERAIQDLDRYLQWRQATGEALLPESALFISHSQRNRGQRLGYDGIRKLLEQMTHQTGIEFHTQRFRYTFATNLIKQGISPEKARVLTRHRSPQSLHRYTRKANLVDE